MNRLQTLLNRLRTCCETFPDKRHDANATSPISNIGMAAFSVFFMQSPSFLAHQQNLRDGHGRSNCETVFGMRCVPGDNHIRAMLDLADPGLLHPAFDAVLTELIQSDDHVLIALDGTETFRSCKLHCPNCSKRLPSNDKTEYYHIVLGAMLV